MMKQHLAIVIPAYKRTYLEEALTSIASQTCKDFTLYIGDDCSSFDMFSIIRPYQSKVDIVYKRFESNLGGRDLVAQWERCIDMTQGEEWLWLFSDDDVMEPDCVEKFYEVLKEDTFNHDIYHFNVKVINEKSEIIRITEPYPKNISSFSFYKGKMIGNIASLVVENIFSREVYLKNKGFKNFDLAWGSDTATWCIFSKEKGIHTIDGANILWRSSSENITPDRTTPIAQRKMTSLCNYFRWAYNFYADHRLLCLYINCRSFINRMNSYSRHLSASKNKQIIRTFCNIHHLNGMEFIFKVLIKLKSK